jgi:hypothetical protein
VYGRARPTDHYQDTNGQPENTGQTQLDHPPARSPTTPNKWWMTVNASSLPGTGQSCIGGGVPIVGLVMFKPTLIGPGTTTVGRSGDP